MSRPSITLSRSARNLISHSRTLHSPGRQIPNPGQGGSPSLTTISPSATQPHTHEPQPKIPIPGTTDHSLNLTDRNILLKPSSSKSHSKSTHERKFTPKGKLIPHRPARTIPVNLPSGYPEPSTYPPPAEYFENLEEKRSKPHPLWQFFHIKEEAKERLDPVKSANGPNLMGSLDLPGSAVGEHDALSGRAWTAAELRQKSFADLHTLWYVLLKERNVLATQREERRRKQVAPQEGGEMLVARAFRCRKSMARIKYVLNERRLGLIAAANPLIKRSLPKVPFSSIDQDDPISAVQALNTLSLESEESQKAGTEVLEADQDAPVVPTGEVAKQEVESRDEGFGGGKEAEEFVKNVKV